MEKDQILSEVGLIKSTFQDLDKKLETEKLKSKIKELEKQTIAPDFWNNQLKAQKIMKEFQAEKSKLDSINNIREKIEDIDTMLEILDEEDHGIDQKEKDMVEIEEMVKKTIKAIQKLETTTYLGGKYDNFDAIISIHAGQGGTEACDWVQMLLRMYTKYFDTQEWKYEITHEIKGNEAGINTVSLEVYGNYVYGYLKREMGTHRLVRVSPFNSQGLRQTSFAGVEIMPIIDDDIDVNLNPEDIQFSAVRSGGAGGQHVNKTSTSVRLIHTPTGITVTNSSGRSQHQNKDAAMRMLRAKLFQIEQEKLDKEMNKLKGEHKIAGWGNQIRNYVLQPYKLVKDLRTKVETDQTEKVLDGALDEFIEAEIKL